MGYVQHNRSHQKDLLVEISVQETEQSGHVKSNHLSKYCSYWQSEDLGCQYFVIKDRCVLHVIITIPCLSFSIIIKINLCSGITMSLNEPYYSYQANRSACVPVRSKKIRSPSIL
jgi:hypothetical protein